MRKSASAEWLSVHMQVMWDGLLRAIRWLSRVAFIVFDGIRRMLQPNKVPNEVAFVSISCILLFFKPIFFMFEWIGALARRVYQFAINNYSYSGPYKFQLFINAFHSSLASVFFGIVRPFCVTF